MGNKTPTKIELTKIQQKFFNSVVELIQLDDELLNFARSKASGKTTVLKYLDEFLSSKIVGFNVYGEFMPTCLINNIYPSSNMTEDQVEFCKLNGIRNLYIPFDYILKVSGLTEKWAEYSKQKHIE